MTAEESAGIDMMRGLLEGVIMPNMRRTVEHMQSQGIGGDLANVCCFVLLRTAARLHAGLNNPSNDFLELAETERWLAQAEVDAVRGGGNC